MMLLQVLAVVALSVSALAFSEEYAKALKEDPSLIQFLVPNVPSEEFALKNGILRAGGAPCNPLQLSTCQNEFAKNLGQNNADIFNNPIQFSKLVRSYYKKDLEDANGISKLCASQIAFRNCLGISYLACTDPYNILTKQNQKWENAFLLGGVYDDIEFDCGGGFTQSVNNWNCIKSINNAAGYDTLIKPCIDDYTKNKKDDQAANCDPGQKLATCIYKAYQVIDPCGKNSTAVQWWACERVDRRFQLEGFCAGNNCASIFPVQTSSDSEKQSFGDFVRDGGLLSDAQRSFYKMVVRRTKQLNAQQHQLH